MHDYEQALAGVGSALSGTVGNVVFSHNAHGPYHYTKPARINPDTVPQRSIRNAFRNAAQLWPYQPQSRRDAWAAYAANVKHTNRLGTPCLLSGFQRYMAVATLRGWTGVFPPYIAPTIFTLAHVTSPTYTEFLSVYLIVDFSLSDEWIHSRHGAVWLYQTRPQSSTVNSWHGPFINFAYYTGDPVSPPARRYFRLLYPPTGFQRRFWFRAVVINPDNRISRADIQMFDY